MTNTITCRNCLTTSLMIAVLLIVDTSRQVRAQNGPNMLYPAPSALGGKVIVIPAGTTLEGRLKSTIGSSVSKQGERFAIEMTSPALANGADVLIPAGSEICGEVVEAIPSNRVPHRKKEKPTGKLRIQINALRMPDGNIFPLVASLVGEKIPGSRARNPNIGGGIAYSGSANSFAAVAPGRTYGNIRRGRFRGPHLVTKQELMQDPIYGRDPNSERDADQFDIRSLILKKRDLYIYEGSPLTVHLDGPLKMGIAPAQSAVSQVEGPTASSTDERFDRTNKGVHNAAPESASNSTTTSDSKGSGKIFPDPKSVLPKPNSLPFQVPAKTPSSPGVSPDETQF